MTIEQPGGQRFEPTETPFGLRVDERGRTAVIELSGSCTMSDAGRLKDGLRQQAERDIDLIILDMRKLDFIESTGLGGIISGYLRLRRRHGELRIVQPLPPIQHLLELTRLTQLFRVYPTVESAMN